MPKVITKPYAAGFSISSNPDFTSAQLLLSAHSAPWPGAFKVPPKTRIWFYCPNGTSLEDIGILNFSRLDVFPYEIYESGSVCPNLVLGRFDEEKEINSIEYCVMFFSRWMRGQLKGDEKLYQTRPIDLATITKTPWYKPNIVTLKDVVSNLQYDDSVSEYSDILCALCRGGLNPFVDGYDPMIKNSEQEIWYVTQNGREQRKSNNRLHRGSFKAC